jgi:hypothetical protein
MIIGILALSVIAVFVAFIVIAWKRSEKDAEAFNGSFTQITGTSLSVCGERDISIAHDAAERALIAVEGTWEDARNRLKGVRIVVRPTVIWREPTAGGYVAGISDDALRIVYVGCDYAALAHEFAEMIMPRWHAQGDWNGLSQLQKSVDAYAKWATEANIKREEASS